MDIDAPGKQITCRGDQTTPDLIIKSGKFFSGSIAFSSNTNNWILFELVNKEKMSYILKDIIFNKEVKFEIFTYDEYPKKIQYSSDWDKIN